MKFLQLATVIAILLIIGACSSSNSNQSVFKNDNQRQIEIPKGDGPHYGPMPEDFFSSAKPTLPDAKKTQIPIAATNRSSLLSINIDSVKLGPAFISLGHATGLSLFVDPKIRSRRSEKLTVIDKTSLESIMAITRANNLTASINGEKLIEGDTRKINGDDVIYITTHEKFLALQNRMQETSKNFIGILQSRRKTKIEIELLKNATKESDIVVKSYRFKYADPVEAMKYLETLFIDFDKETVKSEVGRSGKESTLTGRSAFSPDGRIDKISAKQKAKDATVRSRKSFGSIRFALYQPENLLTISAPVAKLKEIMDRIFEIDVRPKQVYIEARIVEIQRNHIKDLGIEWGGYSAHSTGAIFPHNIGVAGGSSGSGPYPSVVSLPAESSIDPATGAPATNPRGASLGITLGSISGTAVLSARLTAMEQSGFSKTLSSPKIVAMNGELASIKSGREIPYQSSSANLGTSVEFREAVISLAVTPLIMKDGRIRMKIIARKDEVDPVVSVQGVPAIKKKEIITHVVVDDGGSVALGGVFEGNDVARKGKTPGLGDIPILGWLFSSKHDEDSQLELLVFITPTIVAYESKL